MAGNGDQRVCVGVVGAPHGVRGEVRIKSETADPLDIAAYGPVRTESGRTLTIRSVRPGKGVVVATFEGIDDRDAVAALKNQRLYIDRDRLPAPDEDEWYYADLIGLSAADTDGAEVGTVLAVQDFGGGELLEIALEGSRRTIFVPFTRAAVPEIDIKAGRLVIDPPEGLFGEDEDRQ